MRGFFAAGLVALQGCTAPLPLYELPSEVFEGPLAALILFDGDDATGATGVFTANTATPPLVRQYEDSVDSLVALRFDRLPTPDSLPTPALRAATEGEPLLPIAAEQFERSTSDSSWRKVEPSQLQLTGSWIPNCPVAVFPRERALIDVRCEAVFCTEGLQQEACQLSIDQPSCDLSELAGQISAVGEIAPSGCVVQAGPALSESSISCPTCSYDIYRPDPEPFVVEQRLQVYDVPFMPDRARGRPVHGYLNGLADAGEFVVSVGHNNRLEQPDCSDAGPSEFLFFSKNANEVAVSRRAPAPACIRDLVGVPSGFVALVGGVPPRLVRFDSAGVEQASVTFDAGTPDSFARVIRLRDGRFASVVGETSVQSQLTLHDGDALEAIRSVTLEYGFAIAELRGGDIVVSEHSPHNVRRYDSQILQERAELRLVSITADRGPNVMVFSEQTGRLFTLSPGPSPSIHTVDNDGGSLALIGLTTNYEAPFAATAAASWISDDADQLIAGRDWISHQAYLARFDSANTRFLPGLHDLGRGAATRSLVDEQGRTWWLMPWTAEVVQTTALN